MTRTSAQPDPTARLRAVDRRAEAALTDMHAYSLLLEGEGERIQRQLESLTLAGGGSDECSRLAARRVEVAEELQALRETTAALQRHSGVGD